MTDARVAALGAVVESLGRLGESFTDADWARPTVCPGWSVRDHVAHLADGACVGLQRPRPDHTLPPGLDHATGPVGEWMEIGVDVRRDRAAADVLAEFVAAGAALVAHLETLDDAGFEATIRGPLDTEMPLAGLIGIAPLDWWMHEQDIRRAVGVAGHDDGPAAAYARDQFLAIFGGRVAAADPPQAVELVISGPLATTVVLGPGEPEVSLSGGLPAFAAAGGGRVDPATLLASGEVEVNGDAERAAEILGSFAFTP